MHYFFKIYGFIQDISDNFPKIKKILQEFAFEEIDVHGNRIDFFYWSNVYLDVEQFLTQLKTTLSSDAYGQIDYIDFLDWKMIRFFIQGSSITSQAIPLNKSMDFYSLT